MDASAILATAQASASERVSAQRDPLTAWEPMSEPVAVEGGHGVAFFARRKSTGVPHACYQRGTDGTGKVTGIPVIAAPALGLVPAPEPAPEPAPKQRKRASK